MATVSDALKALEITEWVLKGSDPTNSDEFASKFRMVIGTNDAGVCNRIRQLGRLGLKV